MAKDSERKTARILYVKQGKSAREIAELVQVAEKTVSNWVNKYGWKSARTAIVTGRKNRISNLRQIIDDFASDRLELYAELKELQRNKDDKKRIQEIRQEMAHIDNVVASWNKTLETYLHVMNQVFKSLQIYDTKLYMKTIDFQEIHVNDKSIELG